MNICNRLLAFREEELLRYKKGCSCGKTLGDYTTVNLTSMRVRPVGLYVLLSRASPKHTRQAGVTDEEGRPVLAYNVIPTTAEAGFDIRIPATVPLDEFKKRMDEWCSEEGTTWELVANTVEGMVTSAAWALSFARNWVYPCHLWSC